MERQHLTHDMFYGYKASFMLASGDGRRLWVSVQDGKTFYEVENLRDEGKIVHKSSNLDSAIYFYNKFIARKPPYK